MFTEKIEAARVKMTWENQMNRSERDYFVEIDVLKWKCVQRRMKRNK